MRRIITGLVSTGLSMGLSIASMPLTSMPATAQGQAVPAAVGACYANPAFCAVVVTSVGWYVYWRKHPPLLCTWAHCILHDPEEPIEHQIIDYVWGDSQREAEARCRAIAAKAGLRFRRVRQTSKNGRRWECHVDNHPEHESQYRRR